MYPRREDRQGEATEGSGVKKHRLRPRKPKRRKQVMPGVCYTRCPTPKGWHLQLFHSRIIDLVRLQKCHKRQVLAAEYCPGNGQQVAY